MITLDAIETAYMHHVHGKLEPDELLVSAPDFDEIKRLVDSCRRSGPYFDEEQGLGIKPRLMYLGAEIRVDPHVYRGTVHVVRTGVRLGTESL